MVEFSPNNLWVLEMLCGLASPPISWLEHIRCYHKSTLPLSKECALVMPHLWNITLILHTGTCVDAWPAAHDNATATATCVLQLPLNMLPMLLPALPLLTPALQLSYREVDNWLLPNTDIPVSLEASWRWSYLCCYLVLPLLPLCCCIHLSTSRTAATSTALP